MTYEHKHLASGRWKELSFCEQMANIGSEFERALNWRKKGNDAYSQKAFERFLELIDLTLECNRGFSRLREFACVREAAVDYFCGDNQYSSSESSWRSYFLHFTYAARKDR